MTNSSLEQQLYNAAQHIEDLQTKVAFQEHTIELLNDALTGQQHQLEKLQYQMKHVLQKVKTIEPSNIAKQSEETPPPHY
ncbi:SlyX family protein [Alteromonas sp. ASW11-130]|uniref:SlyX family protein n=1 Tax=Alteromonas sp. ASW11-130 TaxID=3015775 RepID=UPI002241BB41|nr:SlyX family protein [Alteromonas sp. ASW11-130]MCW8093303.1 SlyX family protein [Alteromonas sp. ASW11-130]